MDIGIEYPSDAQLKNCWDKLDNLEVHQKINRKDHAPNKPELWDKCCQMYQDCYGTLKFKSDYSQITKTERQLGFKEILKQYERD